MVLRPAVSVYKSKASLIAVKHTLLKIVCWNRIAASKSSRLFYDFVTLAVKPFGECQVRKACERIDTT